MINTKRINVRNFWYKALLLLLLQIVVFCASVECQSVTDNTVTSELRPGTQNDGDNNQLLGHQRYTTLQSLLDEFRNGNTPEHKQIAYRVLSHYKHECSCPDELPKTVKHKVFVAVESNSMSTRQILAARFAKHLAADVYRVLPKCLQAVRKYLREDNQLLDVFYLLGVYVATMQMSKNWENDPVIITGSWIDKAAHMIARRYREELPPPESAVYKLSCKDLTMPDIIFYAFFADDVHRTPETTRAPNAWKHRVTEIFRRMEGPPLFILDCKVGFENMVREMINHTLNTLNDTYDLKYLWPYWDQLQKPKLS